MCTGGVNAKNVNDYLGYDQIFAVGGTWMCKSDVIKLATGQRSLLRARKLLTPCWACVCTMSAINTGNEEEAMKVATLLGGLLNMKVAPGNSSILCGQQGIRDHEKPGRGTNGTSIAAHVTPALARLSAA